ncbi:MAG: hypothetical protein Q8Q56_03975 [Alphaproteobacteria bacterium]|nr:hypothetical protein [Alphaproteobacteria bacterium]
MNNQIPKKLPWAISFGMIMMTLSYGAGIDQPRDTPIRDRWEFATLFAVERKEGRAEGRTEGEKNAKIQIAKGMLEEKMDLSLIARLTGLTTDEIEAIREGRSMDGDRAGDERE